MRYTVLVDDLHPLKESFYKKIEFIKVKNIYQEEVLVEKTCYEAFIKLKEYYQTKNIEIGIINGYQDIPCSEFQTGLALTITCCQDNEEILYEEFGFIERVLGTTKYIRYVGVIPAKIMKERHFSLEDYLQKFGCILYINKPKGVTSFDVVHEISHIFGIKRVGHTGTLDPMATGVLVVAVGRDVKIVELIMAKDKEYIADIELGYQTDTYDVEGEILHRKDIPKDIDLNSVLKSYQKIYQQEVPIYSAIKVEGKKLYEYARENKEVVLPKREVSIREIELLGQRENQFQIRVLVSKGTYIRSLVNDIGISLGTYATLSSLERTKQGTICIEDTNTLEELREGDAILHTMEEVLDYPCIQVDDSLGFLLKNGVRVENQWNIKDKVVFKTKENQLIGIYEVDNDTLKVWKNFT